jgi:hypothetical protein
LTIVLQLDDIGVLELVEELDIAVGTHLHFLCPIKLLLQVGDFLDLLLQGGIFVVVHFLLLLVLSAGQSSLGVGLQHLYTAALGSIRKFE